MVKKLIKHSTCRRRLTGESVEHGSRKPGLNGKRWKQTFKKGYIEVAFTRACVRESLQHGEANAPYRLR